MELQTPIRGEYQQLPSLPHQEPHGSRQHDVLAPAQPPRNWKTVTYAVIALLLLLGFVLQIEGVGSARQACGKSSYSGVCDDFFRSFWWATFFEAIVCVVVAATVLFGIWKDVQVPAIAFLAMATVLLMEHAEHSLDMLNKSVRLGSQDSHRTASAGYIISAMANFVLLLVLGIEKISKPTVPEFLTKGFSLQPERASWEVEQTRLLSNTAPVSVDVENPPVRQ